MASDRTALSIPIGENSSADLNLNHNHVHMNRIGHYCCVNLPVRLAFYWSRWRGLQKDICQQKRVYQYESIDTSHNPPLFSLDSTFKATSPLSTTPAANLSSPAAQYTTKLLYEDIWLVANHIHSVPRMFLSVKRSH